MYLVIVGAGNIGTPLTEMATVGGGNEVVVIERDPEKAEQAATEFDCLVVNDDATSKEVLEDAGVDRADALRDSVFQFVSALTCTGFQSAPIGDWSSGGKLLVSGAMVIGGAVVNVSFGGRSLNREEMNREFAEVSIVSLLWLGVLVGSTLALVNLVGTGFTYADVLFEVASAQGNVGLSAGITGPSMPPLGEAMFCSTSGSVASRSSRCSCSSGRCCSGWTRRDRLPRRRGVA